MTIDPVRLLAQDDDAFAASLLKAGRDADTAAARSRKAAVLGAAGGAAVGGAALVGAKVASKGVWATFAGKWLALFVLAAGGAGVTAAVLLSDERSAPEPGGEPAAVVTPPPTEPAAAAKPAAEAPAPSEPAAAQEPTPAEPPAAPAGSDGSPASAKGAAASTPRSNAIVNEPAPTASSAPSAAASAPADPASELAEEVAALRTAREALGRGQAQKCLEAVNAYFARFPKGHLILGGPPAPHRGDGRGWPARSGRRPGARPARREPKQPVFCSPPRDRRRERLALTFRHNLYPGE